MKYIGPEGSFERNNAESNIQLFLPIQWRNFIAQRRGKGNNKILTKLCRYHLMSCFIGYHFKEEISTVRVLL